jgi:protein-disulfide isomerase
MPTSSITRKFRWLHLQMFRNVLLVISLLSLPSPISLAISAQDSTKPPVSSSPASSDKKSVLAEVDGKEISTGEIETGLGAQLAQLEEQIYQLKRQRLDALISERLLNQEAERRAMTAQALFEAEVTSKAATVTAEEIEAFYKTNQAQLGVLDENLKLKIKNYLQGQRVNARREEFLQSLRAKAKIKVNLPLPANRIKASIEGVPFKGGANAPVTIIEFSDYHCPFCLRVQAALAQVMARYGDKVKLVYRDMPIDQLHPQARRAAEAARCANDQGKFWPYHDQLYSGGADVSSERLKSIAQSSGLDVAAFESCLASGKHRASIQQSIDEATWLGLSGTPAFLINGRFLSGAQPFEAFVSLIEEELAQARANEDKSKPRQ